MSKKNSRFPGGIVKTVEAILAAVMVIAAMNIPALALGGTDGLETQDLNTGITPTELVQQLVGPGVVVSNVVYTGAPNAAGKFKNGSTIIGIDEGIILSSGSISNVIGPNTGDGTTTNNGFAGDAWLNSLIPGYTTHDAAVLEFDFVPNGNTVTFKYVFGSEEYNEYVKSSFNDVFGFEFNGQNVAVIPGTTVPVSINNVNNGNNPYGVGGSHPEYFINNDLQNGGGSINIELDGQTTVLTVQANVNPGEVNHIKLAIADAGDYILDSDVFLQAASFVAYNKGSVTGIKYNDLNENGVKDNDEPVIANWTIKLTDETGNVKLTTTNETGAYNFSELTSGNYVVSEVQQDGWNQTQPVEGQYNVTITTQGENLVGLDFGNYFVVPKEGSITGTKFDDANGNGVKDDGEAGLPDWTIVLSNKTGEVAQQTTDANGTYNFTALAPDEYNVTEVQQDGWYATVPLEGFYSLVVTGSENFENMNFGNTFDVPTAACIKGPNPAGNIPPANGGQRPNGFYHVQADSQFADPMVKLFDDATGNLLATVPSGTDIKYVQNNAKPGAYEKNGLLYVNGNGDLVIVGVNSFGTESHDVQCNVPRPPK